MAERDKILVTGGAGFIGGHLARALLHQGHHVTVVDDLSTGRYSNVADLEKNDRFALFVDSVHDRKLMDRLMQDHRVVYHLASSVGVQLIMEQPVKTIDNIYQTTEVVLGLARRYRNRVLISSTSEVYGKSNDIPFDEDGDRLAGPTQKHRWAYACAKALDEFLALAHWKETRLPVTIVRLFNTVGPRQTGQYGMVVPSFVGRAMRGEELLVHGDGTQSRCFCHVHDVVRALIGVMETDTTLGEVYNVGSSDEIAIGALAEHIIARVGSTSKVRKIPYDEVYGAGFEDMQRRVPSTKKIHGVTGWAPELELNRIIDDIAEDIRSE